MKNDIISVFFALIIIFAVFGEQIAAHTAKIVKVFETEMSR